jgi:ankyrin repeat protein
VAREVIARDHGYASWEVAGAHRDETVDLAFEAAADAVQWGDVDRLRALLDRTPELVTRRSPFPHRATLLHHVAANGIEVERQLQSPPNAIDIARLLLERGSEPDASCETYGGGRSQTTLYLLVSSAHPAAAGVQAALVEELVRGGSLVDGVDDDGLPMLTAITFGYTPAVEALAQCGARVDNIVFAAALGDRAAVRDHLRHPTLATGALLTARNIDGDHLLEHALIAAALHGRLPVVELLLDAGPDLWFTEPTFGSTARGAARYAHHDDIAALLDSLM